MGGYEMSGVRAVMRRPPAAPLTGTPEGFSAVRVKVSDERRLRELLLYLRECGCVAEQARANEADVYLPTVPHERGARMELGVYLTLWTIRNEGASAEIVDD
jgi:hypothetical protein